MSLADAGARALVSTTKKYSSLRYIRVLHICFPPTADTYSKISTKCNKGSKYPRGDGLMNEKPRQVFHALIVNLVDRPSLASMSGIWDNALPWVQQVFKADLSDFEVRKGREWLRNYPPFHHLPALTHTTARHGHHQDLSPMKATRNVFCSFDSLTKRTYRTRFEDLTGCNTVKISALPFNQLINSTSLKAVGTHITAPLQFHVSTLAIVRTHVFFLDQNKRLLWRIC